jgi:vitamin B12/bleomycin/antimicrobial peptide transport system ATP-binding/permease protein
MDSAKRHLLRDAWRLIIPYWTSEEKWAARGLVTGVVALNLGSVYIGVRINEWNRGFYNALQTYDKGELIHQFWIFCLLGVCAMLISVNALFLNQWLQIRWRRWLTRRYLAEWLSDRAYYHLQYLSTTDNPDQRISEDLSQFTAYAMNLSVGLISSVVSLASFLFILSQLSGSADIPLGSWGTLHIPAVLVWSALLYAGVGTWLTIIVGRPLVSLNFARQRYEADFRFSLVRLRENTESIAFYGGEPIELGVFHDRFSSVFTNFMGIMRRQRILGFFTQGYAQMATIFPYLVIAPSYFDKLITLGGLMQVVNAFSFVQNSLSFIVNSYPDIAAFLAVTQRLSVFEERLHAIREGISAPRRIQIQYTGKGVHVRGLDLDLPDGTPLLRGVSFEPKKGESFLITGPTGVGKSTVLRAIAGIWLFGSGEIRLGDERILFVPQRFYLPLGTLENALLYPYEESSGIKHFDEILERVGLGSFADEIETVDNWSQRLSLGEQQRLAFARVLLAKPSIVFLDETTSALDEEAEAELYSLLRAASWRPTVISFGHNTSLLRFHDNVFDLSACKPKSLSRAPRSQLTRTV